MRIRSTAISFFAFVALAGASTACGQSPAERVSNTSGDPVDEATLLREAREVGTVYSLLIERGEEIVTEDYWGGMSAGRTTNIKSASKSVLSLLIGIAIEEGFLEGVDQPIAEFFPEYFEANPDPHKESLTLRDLLTMRTGLESTSGGNYGEWVTSRNWVNYALSRPVIGPRGTRMSYSTGTTHLLSVILTKASGMSTREFANRYLFGPLDITVGGWDRDPQGYYMGGNNMALTTRGLAKIGRLMIKMGVHEGEQLLPRQWILDSVQIYTHSNFNDNHYGYLWWRRKVSGYHTIFAWGSGGQYMIMLPELDTVVVVTSDIANGGERGTRRDIFDFLEERIIPYVEGLGEAGQVGSN